MAVLDEDATVVAVNQAWRDSARSNGLSLEDDGVGLSYLDVCEQAHGPGAEDTHVVAEAIRELLSAGKTDAVFEYTCHSPMNDRWFVARFRGGKIHGRRIVTVVHQEVTDRRRAEEVRQLAVRHQLEALVDARTRELSETNERLVRTERELRQSETRFRAAASATVDVIVEADLENDTLRWFGDVDGRLGYEDGEFPRTSSGFLSRFHSDDRERVRQEVRRAFAADETFRFECRVQAKDGSFRHWESRGRVTARENGRPRLAIGAHRDITERKRDEERLRASEQRFRLMAESTADLLVEVQSELLEWYGDVDGLLGYEPGEFPRTISGWLSAVHPDDVDRVKAAVAASEASGRFSASCRIRCKDGSYRDWEGRGTSFRRPDGQRVGIGAVTDVTEREALSRARRQAELRLQELTTSLFTAQEDERRRLAREFHDAFGQQIAAVSIQLGSLRQLHPELSMDLRSELAGIQDQVVELANDLRRVSHELHPAVLEQLGLEAALRVHCGTLDALEPIDIDFRGDGCPAQLPRNTAICIFRVAQTALRNVIRHSGARKASVWLRGRDGSLELGVEDDGIGFDVAETKRTGGLGVVSMEERVRPLGGHLEIKSTPGRGTQVVARVRMCEDDDPS